MATASNPKLSRQEFTLGFIFYCLEHKVFFDEWSITVAWVDYDKYPERYNHIIPHVPVWANP